jgi:hypothetical protein
MVASALLRERTPDGFDVEALVNEARPDLSQLA